MFRFVLITVEIFECSVSRSILSFTVTRLRERLITPAVDCTVKANVFGFRDNNFSYDIQRYLSNNHAYDKLSGKEDLILDVRICRISEQ
jgi:hypothetical protein